MKKKFRRQIEEYVCRALCVRVSAGVGVSVGNTLVFCRRWAEYNTIHGYFSSYLADYGRTTWGPASITQNTISLDDNEMVRGGGVWPCVRWYRCVCWEYSVILPTLSRISYFNCSFKLIFARSDWPLFSQASMTLNSIWWDSYGIWPCVRWYRCDRRE
jgi:hypothetical protein